VHLSAWRLREPRNSARLFERVATGWTVAIRLRVRLSNISMPNLFDEFRSVVGALGGARIPYAICGGIAMSIHANPRATIDIDLLALPDAVVKIVEVLLPHGFVRRERTPTRLAGGEVVMHRLTKIVPGDPDVLALDVIEVQPGATEAAWLTRTSAEWEGRSVTVVSRAGLIAMKRLRGSPQDIADIAVLEGQE
jgi:hypothetical protein